MTRCARERRVYFVEEPLFHHGAAELEVSEVDRGVQRVVPRLPHGAPPRDLNLHLSRMIDALLATSGLTTYELWYCTPPALSFTRHLKPKLVVYDVSADGATLDLPDLERELMLRSDLVFTGSERLYQAKRQLHGAVHAFPSRVDVKHFARARVQKSDPADQASIPHPRLGYSGIVDERLDLSLLDRLAEAQPRWHFVMVGPVRDAAKVPRRPNLHWLGEKTRDQLPDYLSGWDVALLPFARDVADPTATAELLAAGRPIVATPVTDIVNPYGELHLLRLASDAEGFVTNAKAALGEDRATRLHRTDAFLAAMSWDTTWHRMTTAMAEARARRKGQDA
jgi:UDP-galactopyranose mutase